MWHFDDEINKRKLYTPQEEQNVSSLLIQEHVLLECPKICYRKIAKLGKTKINCNCLYSVIRKLNNLMVSSYYIALYTMHIVSKHLHTNKQKNYGVRLLL